MIVFIRGVVFASGQGYVDIDVHGVGHRVWVPEWLAEGLPVGEDALLYTHHHIREDAHQLFGFADVEDREWFELLLSVSGVGPKGALQVISASNWADFIGALASDDLDALCKLPGIGKKTAQRLLVELKDKVALQQRPAAERERIAVRPEASRSLSPHAADVVDALRMLGYNERQAIDTVEGIVQSDATLSVEDVLKLALQQLDRQSTARGVGR